VSFGKRKGKAVWQFVVEHRIASLLESASYVGSHLAEEASPALTPVVIMAGT